MGSFHVYVDGPKESGADAMRRLAEAMQLRYGLPASELISRMSKGRFRVKGNIDVATANIYRRDLEAIGARVTIEETANPRDATGPAARPSPMPRPTPPSGSARSPGRTKSGSAPGRNSSSGIVEVNRSTQSPNMDVSRSPASASKAPIGTTPPGRTGMTPPLASPVIERVVAPGAAPQANAARPAASGLPASPPRASAQSLPPRPASAPVLPPSNAARPGGPSLPPSQQAPAPFASGLAAAYGGDAPKAASLGALDHADGLSLASLDGQPDHTPNPLFDAAASTPEVELSATIGPPSRSGAPVDLFAPSGKPGKPVDVPVDLFAPPDAGDQDIKVELAADEIAHRNKRAATPPPMAPPMAPRMAPPMTAPIANAVPLGPANASPSSPVLQHRKQATMTPAFGTPPAIVMRETPRWRLAAGVAAAIVLGFLPAHIVASVREGSADREIDAQVEAVQKQADTEQAWASLDTMRAAQLERKRSDHRNIMLVSLLIWAAAGAGIGYVWFRRVPWNRLGLG